MEPSEAVPADGIRITALGTGTPDVRKGAVATSYLIQLGSGENFLFDLGTGSYLNLLATGVPQDTLTKACAVSSSTIPLVTCHAHLPVCRCSSATCTATTSQTWPPCTSAPCSGGSTHGVCGGPQGARQSWACLPASRGCAR